MRNFICILFLLAGYLQGSSQNILELFNTHRLSLQEKIEVIDLDMDGDPDLIKAVTSAGIPIQWIDDDDDMQNEDLMGDLDSDCLMADINKDGNYGHYSDVYVDWVDNDNDGKADMQIYVEYCDEGQKDKPWGPGHLMVNMDLDQDGIMNYIDWNTFELRCWLHDGQAAFYEDYHGKTLFLKIHTSPEKMNDLRLNWENPFLFYDPDEDGLTEYAIRVIDYPVRGVPGDEYLTRLTGKVSWISMAYDLDNDNYPGNELDFDMTISFRGEGFDYMDQVHSFPQMRGLELSDQYFMDPRFRQTTELIYPDHESIQDLIFNRGKWEEVYFAYDEDDDCTRWERVELYDPKDPYITGIRNGGLDHHQQSDAVGNRGEWDLDNSGGGKLYISKLDGKIHLYGAELSYWRIDQNAYYYHGMGGLYDGYGKGRLSREVNESFPLVKYTDTDENGFFDKIEYDFDGDKKMDQVFSLQELGIDDKAEIIGTGKLEYTDFGTIQTACAENQWENALTALSVAAEKGIDPAWYSLLRNPVTVRQKYHKGYWLQFYLFQELYSMTKGEHEKCKIAKAYFSSDWKSLAKKNPR